MFMPSLSLSHTHTHTHTHELVIRVLYKLDNDVLGWLNLEHFKNETDKRSRLNIASVNTTQVIQLHGTVYEQLSCVCVHVCAKDNMEQYWLYDTLHTQSLPTRHNNYFNV